MRIPKCILICVSGLMAGQSGDNYDQFFPRPFFSIFTSFFFPMKKKHEKGQNINPFTENWQNMAYFLCAARATDGFRQFP